MVRGALRSRFARATATVAAVVLLASCGSSGSSGSGTAASAGSASSATASSSASGSSSSSAVPTGAPAEAPAILQFSAPLVSGGALDGTTFTGKPVAFWFWAPW